MQKEVGIVGCVVHLVLPKWSDCPIRHLQLFLVFNVDIHHAWAVALPERCKRELFVANELFAELLSVERGHELDSKVAYHPLEVAREASVKQLQLVWVFEEAWSEDFGKVISYLLLEDVDDESLHVAVWRVC